MMAESLCILSSTVILSTSWCNTAETVFALVCTHKLTMQERIRHNGCGRRYTQVFCCMDCVDAVQTAQDILGSRQLISYVCTCAGT